MLQAHSASRAPDRILPFDVRYALRYRKAELCMEEILVLAESGFENEAAYLILKMAVDDPFVQLTLMQSFIDSVTTVRNAENYTNGETREAVQWFVRTNAARFPKGATVPGGKLAQISRQGFSHWDSLYRDSAERLAQDQRSTYVIGHSTFIGLAAYVQSHHAASKELRILIPSFVTDERRRFCGYSVLSDVRHLSKEFEREHEAIIIDDTKHTGACMRRMQALRSGEKSNAPSFEFFTIIDKAAVCGS